MPGFSLRREDGSSFTERDLLGRTTVLVFYPFAFSDVCTDQMQVYEEALADIADAGATMYGVSCDAIDSQKAFRTSLGITIPQLSDFEPKGSASRAFGAYFEPGGMATRALVIVGPRRRRQVELGRRAPGCDAGRQHDLRRSGGGFLSGSRGGGRRPRSLACWRTPRSLRPCRPPRSLAQDAAAVSGGAYVRRVGFVMSGMCPV